MSLLVRDRAALVVVDVQEAFRPYASFAGVAESCAKLLQGARILGLPSVVTEQYPKGLGHTAPELGLQDERPIEKTVFSAARAERFDLAGREQALVCGIETHVCVSQTVHDLLAAGSGAALLDLPTPKIEVGAPANLTLVDLAMEWEVGENGYESRSANCCFAGRTLTGRVGMTIAGGAVAFRTRSLEVVS